MISTEVQCCGHSLQWQSLITQEHCESSPEAFGDTMVLAFRAWRVRRVAASAEISCERDRGHSFDPINFKF